MRVLQINCVYKTGSTGEIVSAIHDRLKKEGYESYVCYGRGLKEKESDVYKTSTEIDAKINNVISRFSGIQFGRSYLATFYLIYLIKKIKPDVVHLHCLNGFFVNIYWLLSFLKSKKIQTVLTLHAEFMYTGGCGHAIECNKWKSIEGCSNCPHLHDQVFSYFLDRTATAWKRMKKAFDGFSKLTVVSVSPWLMYRARESIILGNKNHRCILNGVNTNYFLYQYCPELRLRYAEPERPILLFVTSGFSVFKGADYLLSLSAMLNNFLFIVVGTNAPISNCPSNVISIGRISDAGLLAQYYSIADATILLSQRETFSLVCAESLCCGTPVVGFKAGAPETICIPKYCRFCEYGDIQELRRCCIEVVSEATFKDKRTISAEAIKKYSNDIMTNCYLECYLEQPYD